MSCEGMDACSKSRIGFEHSLINLTQVGFVRREKKKKQDKRNSGLVFLLDWRFFCIFDKIYLDNKITQCI